LTKRRFNNGIELLLLKTLRSNEIYIGNNKMSSSPLPYIILSLTILSTIRLRKQQNNNNNQQNPNNNKNNIPLLTQILQSTLQSRKTNGSLRSLAYDNNKKQPTIPMTDFSSNDYIGLARNETLSSNIHQAFSAYSTRNSSTDGTSINLNGSTGSRLLSGDSPLYQSCEQYLASFYHSQSALLFNSGYDANVSIFSCVPQPNGIIIFDELSHASMRQGIINSRSSSIEFKHNNIQDLHEKLIQARTTSTANNNQPKSIIIAVEAVYSMDGHVAPLCEICNLAKQFQAYVIVDEAHSTGIFGPQGEGFCEALQLSLSRDDDDDEPEQQADIFARVHTFGKAIGCHGAVIVGSNILRSFLINYAKPLIYSTAMSPHAVISIWEAHQYLTTVATKQQTMLQRLIHTFKQEAITKHHLTITNSDTPIQAIFIPNNNAVVTISRNLLEAGFSVFPIRAPTVPKGTERLRVILHTFNSEEQIIKFLNLVVEQIALFKI
jgi:8-amino-7-oxononanoate synthase